MALQNSVRNYSLDIPDSSPKGHMINVSRRRGSRSIPDEIDENLEGYSVTLRELKKLIQSGHL